MEIVLVDFLDRRSSTVVTKVRGVELWLTPEKHLGDHGSDRTVASWVYVDEVHGSCVLRTFQPALA